jgi:hypothetical protein
MRGHVGPAPYSPARTLALALFWGLLVIGLALEVAVATVNERPVNSPANCADSTRHQPSDTSQGDLEGGICP